MRVSRFANVGRRDVTIARQPVEQRFLVVQLRRAVEFGAIARRETDGVAQLARELGGARQVERHPLAQLDRRDVMGQADEGEGHVK